MGLSRKGTGAAKEPEVNKEPVGEGGRHAWEGRLGQRKGGPGMVALICNLSTQKAEAEGCYGLETSLGT